MIDRAQVNSLLDSDMVDPRGEKIGAVRQVWLDDRTGQPLWAEVHTGLFGMKDTFVPIQDARVGDGQVVVPVDKKTVKDSPHISVDGGHMSESQQEELYRYYGMVPSPGTGDHDRLKDRAPRGNGRQEAAAGQHAGQRPDPRGQQGADARGRGAADRGMTRHEEQLQASVRDVEVGKVRLVKHVVTEQQQITVPVEREEVRVVREPVDGTEPDGRAFTEDSAEVTLHKQEPVVEKTVRPVERVRLDKETVTDQERVTGEVRKERIDVEDGVERPKRPQR
ncbi:DUF2382 domain-containing protein [Actinokineospora soli]|uniref:DUF2382 domain-containing protein n=1 Tax=Actinokineospora soli TaxID=1048753 RepID=A0ABW2TMS8_9PSEU